IVNSQPLTRSITVKVNADAATSAEQKTLKGTVVTAGIEDSREVETSGEKLVGEKAEGKVKIVNKTDSEREFKKGTTLVYDSDDKEYAFTTNDEVTVPAATSEEETPGGTITITPGSAEVEVTAAEIGSTYNIKKDKSLEV